MDMEYQRTCAVDHPAGADAAGVNDRRTRRRTAFEPIELDGKIIIGVDPGRRDVIACAWRTENGDDNPDIGSNRFSNAEYQVRSGAKDASKLRLKWLRRAPDHLASRLSAVPSAKTDLQAHITALLVLLKDLLMLNMKRRVRSLRFSQHARIQRVTEAVVNRILAPATLPAPATGAVGQAQQHPASPRRQAAVVVAFGNAHFSSTSRGYAPAPVQRVKQALSYRDNVELVLIDEDYTSQLCHRCHNKLQSVTGKADRNGKRKPLWAVKRCVDEECSCNFLNRDTNAALNILHIFLEQAHGGGRPAVFTKQHQLPLEPIREAELKERTERREEARRKARAAGKGRPARQARRRRAMRRRRRAAAAAGGIHD